MNKTIIILVTLFCFGVAFTEELFFIDRGDTVFLYNNNKTRSTNDWLVTQNGHRVKIAEGIIVELKSEFDAKIVFDIPDVKSYETLSGNIFLVIPTDTNQQFSLSRKFLSNKLVLNSHPNLIRERIPR